MLKTKHFFPFVRMVRALGVKDLAKQIQEMKRRAEAKARTLKEKGEEAEQKTALDLLQEEAGIDILALLIDRLPDAEQETYDFLAVYTGKKREELEELPIRELLDLLKGLIAEENFSDFLQSASE